MLRCCTALAVLLVAPVVRADVLVVPSPAYFQPQDAIDAAQDGDTVLIFDAATIIYDGFTIAGKGIHVIGNTPGIELESQIVIRDTAAHQTVLISRFVVEGVPWSGSGPYGTAGHGLVVENTLGPVRVAECTFRGALGPGLAAPSQAGYHAAKLAGYNADVAFVRCTFVGGEGATMAGGSKKCGCFPPGGRGGDGLRFQNSLVQLSECTLRGGEGGYGDPNGGRGGDGLNGSVGELVSSGSTFHGGDGNYGCDCCCFPQSSGDGGHGLVLSLSAQAWLHDDAFLAGTGAPSCFGSCGIAGVDGIPQLGPATFLSGAARSFSMASPAREGLQMYTSIHGEPGDLVFLAVSLQPGRFLLPHFGGVLVMGLPLLSLEPIAVLPHSGVLDTGTLMPLLPPGMEAATIWLQALMSSDLVSATLSSWSPLVLLDASF